MCWSEIWIMKRIFLCNIWAHIDESLWAVNFLKNKVSTVESFLSNFVNFFKNKGISSYHCITTLFNIKQFACKNGDSQFCLEEFKNRGHLSCQFLLLDVGLHLESFTLIEGSLCYCFTLINLFFYEFFTTFSLLNTL